MKSKYYVIAALVAFSFIASIGLVSAYGFNSENTQSRQANYMNQDPSLCPYHEDGMNYSNKGVGFQRGNDFRQTVMEAVENKDYQAFIDAQNEINTEIENNQEYMFRNRQNMLEIIDSEAKFNLLVEKHEAMESGDFETVQEISEELGLNMPHTQGHRGMHRRFN